MRGRLVAVAFILIMFGFGVGALQHSYFDAGVEGGAARTTTETVEVDEGNLTTLSRSNSPTLVYTSEENIIVEQSSKDFPPEGNWRWNRHNGTIFWVDGGNLTDGSNAEVTYTFADPTDNQKIVKDISTGPLTSISDEWIVTAILVLVLAASAILVGRARQ